MFSIDSKGDWSKTREFLKNLSNGSQYEDLESYGRLGVEALQRATPEETGETANHWYYKVHRRKKSATISWHNDHVVEGYHIAILIQYGHGTRGGTYVPGVDYINPTMQPVFDHITEDVWKKVKSR